MPAPDDLDFPRRSIVPALHAAFDTLYRHIINGHTHRSSVLPEDMRWVLELQLVFDASTCELRAHHPSDANTVYTFDMSQPTIPMVIAIHGGAREWLLAFFLMSIASHYAAYEPMPDASDTYTRRFSDGTCAIVVTCKDMCFTEPQEIILP